MKTHLQKLHDLDIRRISHLASDSTSMLDSEMKISKQGDLIYADFQKLQYTTIIDGGGFVKVY